MSLISDPDYLIHSLRLSYLRNVDDPYGSRLISLDPSYQSNPYIIAASLADVDRWPELAMPASPPISEDEGDNNSRPSGFPGATGLRHSQTIMGPNRSGGLGLRVSAKRASLSKRHSVTPRQNDVPHVHTESVPTPKGPTDASTVSEIDSDQPPKSAEEPSPAPPDPPPKGVQFIPKFKGAAEMEARRKMRMQGMQARRGGQPPLAVDTRPPPPRTVASLNPEMSSSEDEVGMSESEDEVDSDFGDLAGGAGDDMDEGDEFDPDFAATRTPGINSDSASDAQSIMSGTNSGLSTSNSSALTSSLHAANAMRTRSRLSPVSEAGRAPTDKDNHSAHRRAEKSIDSSHFEMVTPVPPQQHHHHHHPKRLEVQVRPRGSSLLANATQIASPAPEMSFSRQKVLPIRTQKSALTAHLATSSRSSNPFAELYAAISGRAEAASMTVQIFFPHAKNTGPMSLNVRKDATVEEVVGFALWSYWEEGWLPKLDEGVSGEEDPKLSAAGWILKIAEDDGEVDEDFPAPDRTGKISKFNFEAYAVLEATSAQIQQNQQLESKIQRRPSRTTKSLKKQEALTVGGGLLPPSISGPSTSAIFGTTPILSSSLGPSSSHGPQIFLRIRVADTTDTVHISTTIPVSAGMYMQEALELVCRKRKLDPKDFALVLKNDNHDSKSHLLIPLDRTVASLQGKRELLLVKKNALHEMGIELEKKTIRTTDPNASIFKRMSDVPEVQISAAMDFTAAYKKYTIFRKMPMMVTRQERGLAIDGAYIHIMPSSNKARAVFDSGKTTSFHIKSVVTCQQSTKSSSIFKLVVQNDHRNKRYDFEAETPKLASEIVQNVRSMKAALERSSTVGRSRRSRQVV